MATVDFSSWAVPDLKVTLGGKRYAVRPPSVDEARVLVALCAQSEVSLGLATGPLDADLADVIDQVADKHIGDLSLTPEVHAEMLADGVAQMTVDRIAYYAVHYWVRGKARADALATLLWSPREAEPDEDDEDVGGGSPGEA